MSGGSVNNESEEVFLDSIEFTYATFSSSSLITSTTSGLNEESASSHRHHHVLPLLISL